MAALYTVHGHGCGWLAHVLDMEMNMSVWLGGVCVVHKMADVEYFTTPGSQYSLLSANDIEYGIC